MAEASLRPSCGGSRACALAQLHPGGHLRAPGCGGRGQAGRRARGAYLGRARLGGPCFASSCGNALCVPPKSSAVYSFGHNIHICEAYQLQETQWSSRPRLNSGRTCHGKACNTLLIKKTKKKNPKKQPSLFLRAKSIMDSVKMTEFKNVNDQGLPDCSKNSCHLFFILTCSLSSLPNSLLFKSRSLSFN